MSIIILPSHFLNCIRNFYHTTTKIGECGRKEVGLLLEKLPPYDINRCPFGFRPDLDLVPKQNRHDECFFQNLFKGVEIMAQGSRPIKTKDHD